MSEKQPHKDEPEKPETASPREQESAKDETKPKYEFKILPADPKNNFDFEDVADK